MAAKGEVGAPRHRKVLRDNIQGIKKPALLRLFHRAGITRVSGLVYEEVRGIIKIKLEELLHDVTIFTEHDRRKTVMVGDVEAAIEARGEFLAVPLGEGKKSGASKKCKDRPSYKSEESMSTRKFRPGTSSRRDVAFQQKNGDCLSFQKLPFERFIREVAQDYKTDLRFSEDSLLVIQHYIEQCVVDLSYNAGLEAKQAQRETVFPKDFQMARRVADKAIY